jgi:hypothetical protein
MCRPLESFTYHADLLLKSAGLSRSDGQGKDVVGRPLTFDLCNPLSVVNEFTGLIFTIGEGRDGGAGGPTNANGADISAGAVGF